MNKIVIFKKFLLVVVLFFSGCATKYQSLGFTGGYSEIITSKNSFIVNFKGNDFTTSNTVMKYALMRASELTLANGYKYFIVLSSTDQTETLNYSNTQNNSSEKADLYGNKTTVRGTSNSTTYTGKVVEPAISLSIKCFEVEPLNANAIDAVYFLINNQDN